jgi:hypothetical protein
MWIWRSRSSHDDGNKDGNNDGNNETIHVKHVGASPARTLVALARSLGRRRSTC